VNNFGVIESVPPPPNQGGPWRLVWRNDTTPPGWDWENGGAPVNKKRGGDE